MARTYRECDGVTPVDHNIEVTQVSSCVFDSAYWVSTYYHTDYLTTMQVDDGYAVNAVDDYTVKVKLTGELKVWTSKASYEASDPPLQTYNPIRYEYVDILQGQTQAQWETLCLEIIEVTGGSYSRETLDSFEMVSQSPVPSCAPEPPSCALGITGYTTTLPSERGEDDGEISIGLTGQTGTTITWTIDGNAISATTPHITVTGLTSDTYLLYATEADCYASQSVVLADGEFRTGDFVVVAPSTNDYIVAAENPVMINIATSVNSFSPLLSINSFSVDGTISDVVITFELTFPYVYTAVFYSKGFPDRGNYFLESVLTDGVGTPAGTNTATEIATSLAEAFENDSILSRLYYISNDGTDITLTSKEYNGEYDLSASNVTITGSNLTLANEQAGVAQYDGQLASNYSVYTELYIDDQSEYGVTPDPTLYRRITELELPYQQDNDHQFDLSPTLKNFVSSPKYSFDFSGVTFVSEAISSYYTKYGEKYPLVANSNTKKKRYKGQTDYNWVINSALDFEAINTMNTYFPLSGNTVVKFLNTAPNTKYSHRDGKEFLSMVLSSNYQYATRVYADINMYDGTVHSDVILYDITTTGVTTNYGGIAVLAVAYDCTCISGYETGGAKIRSLDVVVKQFSGSTWVDYSETKTFKYELDEQPDNFNVAFLNKFGCFETYSFIGEVVEDEAVTRTSYQRPYDINADGSATSGFEYNSTIDTNYTKVYVLNTGIIDADTWYFLQGLIQSNRIYHYDEDTQTYLTIIDQTSTKSTNTNEYSLQIQVIETINENNVSQ